MKSKNFWTDEDKKEFDIIYSTFIEIIKKITITNRIFNFFIKYEITKMLTQLLIFFISFLILNSAKTDFKDRNTTIFKDVINSYSFQEKFLEAQDFNKTRVRESFDQTEIKMFKKFLDVVLKPEETYYDFSSKNY